MAKITKLEILSDDPNNSEVKHWQWQGVCPCGQECDDSEIATEQRMRVNASVTVCSTCMAEAYDGHDFDDE